MRMNCEKANGTRAKGSRGSAVKNVGKWYNPHAYQTSSLVLIRARNVCGPPPMVEAAIALLERRGVPEAHIYFDKFTTTADE